jgi:hypothetical protein
VRTISRVISVLLLVTGLPALGLAAVALAYAWLAPVQPPPSLNEGPGMAGVIGWILLIPSAVAVIVGIAMHVGLNATRAPKDIAWAREHRRLW